MAGRCCQTSDGRSGTGNSEGPESMADFDDIRKDLLAARAGADTISRRIFQLRQHVARLKRERQRLERMTGSRHGAAGNPTLARLDERIEALEAEIEGLRARLEAAMEAERRRF